MADGEAEGEVDEREGGVGGAAARRDEEGRCRCGAIHQLHLPLNLCLPALPPARLGSGSLSLLTRSHGRGLSEGGGDNTARATKARDGATAHKPTPNE